MHNNNTNHNISQLSISDTNIDEVVCIGDDVFVSSFISADYPFPNTFATKGYLVCSIKRGNISGFTNGVATFYQAPQMVVILPDNEYSFVSASQDIDASIIEFSSEFSNDLNLLNRYKLNFALKKQASMQLSVEMQKVMSEYEQSLRRIAKYSNNPFRREAALNLTRAFFYGVGCYYFDLSHTAANTRQDEIINKFLSLVEQYGSTQRRIEFYAQQMHLSAKYIAAIVQRETGLSCAKWTEEATIKQAKQLILNTNLTMQQIALELGFKDQAYFGAYFKRAEGMSPKKYRIEER